MKEEKETSSQPKILFYQEFEDKEMIETNGIAVNNFMPEFKDTDSKIIPFIPIEQIEEKISADNIENEVENQL